MDDERTGMENETATAESSSKQTSAPTNDEYRPITPGSDQTREPSDSLETPSEGDREAPKSKKGPANDSYEPITPGGDETDPQEPTDAPEEPTDAPQEPTTPGKGPTNDRFEPITPGGDDPVVPTDPEPTDPEPDGPTDPGPDTTKPTLGIDYDGPKYSMSQDPADLMQIDITDENGGAATRCCK